MFVKKQQQTLPHEKVHRNILSLQEMKFEMKFETFAVRGAY